MREKFGLIVESFEDVLTPALRPRKVTVPQLDGAVDYGAEAYEERQLVINCATVALLTRGACRELSYAISRKAKIIRWDEPDKYYIGQVYDPAAIERIAGRAKRFSLPFVCDPFAYGEQRTISFNGSSNLNYSGTARTPTRITIVTTTAMNGLTITMREGMNL